MEIKIGIGQDSHRFGDDESKKCVLGGVQLDDTIGFESNSNGDAIIINKNRRF